MAKILVTAGEGRTVPLPREFGTAPGNRLLMLVTSDQLGAPGYVDRLEVESGHSFTVRSLRNGDFVRFTEKKKES
jgi:hypothetical protein